MDEADAKSNIDDRDDRLVSPLWVKVLGSILVLLVLLFVIMLFTRGRHGPGRHLRPTAVSSYQAQNA